MCSAHSGYCCTPAWRGPHRMQAEGPGAHAEGGRATPERVVGLAAPGLGHSMEVGVTRAGPSAAEKTPRGLQSRCVEVGRDS